MTGERKERECGAGAGLGVTIGARVSKRVRRVLGRSICDEGSGADEKDRQVLIVNICEARAPLRKNDDCLVKTTMGAELSTEVGFRSSGRICIVASLSQFSC